MTCKTCELVARRDAGDAPAWDQIIRTDRWDVVHSYNTKLEGWLVLVVRRHVDSLADLSDAEAAELGPLIKNASAALTKVTGCEKTYAVQFAEHPLHPHVHVHIIPRAPGLHPDLRGPQIFKLMAAAGETGVSDERMNQLAAEIRGVWSARNQVPVVGG